MAVDSRWRLYYNDDWLASHSVEENSAVLIHEVSHLLREHEARKIAAAVRDHALWNMAADCEINDDLVAEGLPLPDDPPHPDKFGLQPGEHAETYYRQMLTPAQSGNTGAAVSTTTPRSDSSSTTRAVSTTTNQAASALRASAPTPATTNHQPPATNQRDCGSGAHGERRPWELPDDDGSPGGAPGVDPVKAELVRRDCAHKIRLL